MAGKKTGKRLLTWVLVLVMALSLLPLNALAEENDVPENTNPSIEYSKENLGAHLVKSATKDGDTYQIQLESLVTGKVEQTTGSAPLDIVLVLDQSGSMAENNKLESLKTAVRDFVTAINENADKHNVEHRIAIVGFASNQTEGGSNWGEDGAWYNTGIFVN
ncbi:MAG: VWA domain-containing protein, partial [Oscillibacter sp.]|nr:VWA domain-containing protein [Oscillibacter sp.]